ncbi:MAG: RNA polymerase sigma factor [Sphingobium sp.]|nr:RNA polymerase sigma factor [Sphingobium sp.]
MDDENDSIAEWVADEILPHEAYVRNWLARRWGHLVDVEEVIQDAYYRISGLSSVNHISSGRAYFFKTVQSIVMDAMRHAKVANIRGLTEIEWDYVIDDSPTPDRIAEGRQELGRLQSALAQLTHISRQVIVLRRIHGLSQKETAKHLGVSEHIVENNLVRGVRKILTAMQEEDNKALEESGGK